MIYQRLEDEMNMIGHDNGSFQIIFNLVVVQAAVEHDLSNAFGKYPSVLCAERDKVWFVIAL